MKIVCTICNGSGYVPKVKYICLPLWKSFDAFEPDPFNDSHWVKPKPGQKPESRALVKQCPGCSGEGEHALTSRDRLG